MRRIILSEFVELELAAIWDYIALNSPDAADRFLECTYQTFNELARTPEMGCLRHFRSSRLKDLRSFRVKRFKKYLVFYAPVSGGIEVYHVLHGARDLEKFWG